MICFGIQAQTNIANYTYAISNVSYTPLVGATTFTNGWDDQVSAAIPLGGNFTFGAVTHTACFINSNGYITFGASSTATNYAPLSTGVYSAAISVFGRDGASSTNTLAAPAISYMNIGGASGLFVVEFKDHASFAGRATERLNAQIVLNLATGEVTFIYGSWTAPSAVSTAQIGLRGATTTWLSNVNSLNTVDIPSNTTCNWSNAITTVANNSSMLFSTANVNVVPTNGLMYTWAPPVNAALAPVRVFLAVSAITSNSAIISWTAPTAATQYSVQYRTPGSCSWTNVASAVTTNSVTLTGLTFSTVYQVRVKSSDGTNAAIWSHIPNQAGTGGGYNATGTFSTLGLPIDLQTLALNAPAVNGAGCYGNAIPLVIQLKNAGTTVLDFSTNNATVYTAVSGTNPQTYTTTVNTGTLAANATLNVTVTSTYNMSAVGVYSINATSLLATPDANTANDMMATVTRTTTATAPLPYAQSFPTTTTPLGWTTTGWTIAANHGLTSNGIYKNLWSGATTGTFSLLKLGTVTGSENFVFDYRVLNFTSYPTGGAPTPTINWGNFKVQVSTDCGATFTDLGIIDNTTHTVTTQAWTNKAYSLSAYAGQNVIIRYVAAWVAGDYYIDIDNINVASCFAPTALATSNIGQTSTDISWSAPINGTPLAYIYEVRTSGAAGSGTLGLASTGSVSAASNSTTVIGLTAYTGYSVYVASYCGGIDVSLPTSATTFTTLCTPPTAPTTTNSSQCGIGVPLAQVSGGSAYNWYASATSTTALQTGTLTTYATSINTTTTFYVSVNNGICLSPRTAVTTTVSIPENVMASTSATALCPGSPAVLLSVTQATATTYNFTWTATPSTGSGMPTSVTGQTVSVLPTVYGTYVYQVFASDGICSTTSSVTVISNNIPTILASATPSASCSGSDVNLNATTSIIAAGTATVGNGISVTSSFGYPTAFGNYWYQTWQQYLYTATELSAMGLTAGNITSLAFNISNVPNPNTPLADYNVKIAPTTNTVLSAFTTTGLSNVFGPASVTAATGVNTITFSTPYNWDGVSNLIIDLRQTEFFGSGNATTYYTPTTNNSVLYAYSTSPNASYWTSSPAPSTSTSRPNILFGGLVSTQGAGPIIWQWNPGAINTNTALVNPVNTGSTAITMVYTISATNTVTGCSNTATTSVVVNPLPSMPMAMNATQCGIAVPTASVSGGTSYNWYSSPTATTVLQAGSATNYTPAINATTTWYVSSFNGTCESPRVMLTQTVTTPDAVMATSTSSAVCPGTSYVLMASNTGTTNTYSYSWNAFPTLGSGMPTSVTGSTVVVAPSLAGNYAYVVTAVDGVCTTTAMVNVTAYPIPVITSAMATPTPICSGATFSLNAQSIVLSPNQTLASYTCVPSSAGGNCINYVGINTLNYPSGCETGNYYDVPQSSATTSLTPGKTYTLLISTTASAITSVWFDWNRNGVYESTEWVQPYTTGTSTTIAITVPMSASAGISKMRVRSRAAGNANGASDACSSFGSGEAEDYTFNILADVASDYNWTWNPGTLAGSTTTTSVVNTGTASATYIYSVTATNTITGCSNTKTTSLVVSTYPVLMPTASNSVICANYTTTLSVMGATTYTWLPAGGNTANAIVTPSANTTYTVVGSIGGCLSSATVAITTNPSPTLMVTSSATSAVCPATSVTLAITGASTFTWSPAVSTNSMATVSPTTSVTYTVMGEDLGCITTKTISIAVNPTPTLNLVASNTLICLGSISSSTINVTGTATSFTWSPVVSTSSTAVVSPTMAVTYTVMGTDVNGCTNTKTIALNVANTPTVNAISPTAVVCSGSSATLTSSGTAVNYTWMPVGGNASSAIATPTLGVTSYTLIGQANGCSNKSVATVTVVALPALNASSSSSVICKGQSATLTATTTATSYTWSNGANTISTVVTPTTSANYTITVSNGTCKSNAVVSVSVSPCIGIEELAMNGISVYPNPVIDFVTIAINNDLVDNATANIYDALGKLVISETLTKEVTAIKTTYLDSGVYFVKITSNNRVIRVEKLVRQ